MARRCMLLPVAIFMLVGCEDSEGSSSDAGSGPTYDRYLPDRTSDTTCYGAELTWARPAIEPCYEACVDGSCGRQVGMTDPCGGGCPEGTRSAFSCGGRGVYECPSYECADGGETLTALADDEPARCHEAAADGCCREPIRYMCGDECPLGSVPTAECEGHGVGCQLQACTSDDECVLAPRRDACGEEPTEDVIALHTDNRAEYERTLCDLDARCGDGCSRPSPSPDYVAACDDGICVSFDLRELRGIRCASDDECVLRHEGCCVCDAPSAPIALHRSAVEAYDEAVCPELPECGACEFMPPPDAAASCDAGLCVVR